MLFHMPSNCSGYYSEMTPKDDLQIDFKCYESLGLYK